MWNEFEKKRLNQLNGSYGRTREVKVTDEIVLKTGVASFLKQEFDKYDKYDKYEDYKIFLAKIEMLSATEMRCERLLPVCDLIELNLDVIPEYYLYKIAKNVGYSRKAVNEVGDIDDWRELHNFTTEFTITDTLFLDLMQVLDVKVPSRFKFMLNDFMLKTNSNISEICLVENWGIDENRNLKLFDYAE